MTELRFVIGANAEVVTHARKHVTRYYCQDCGYTMYTKNCMLCDAKLDNGQELIVKEFLSDILTPEQCNKFFVTGYGGEYVTEYPNIVLSFNKYAFPERDMSDFDVGHNWDWNGVLLTNMMIANRCVENFKELYAPELEILRSRAIYVEVRFGTIWYYA